MVIIPSDEGKQGAVNNPEAVRNELPGSCEDCIHIDLAYLDLGVCTLLGQGIRLPREGRLKNCPLEAKWQS